MAKGKPGESARQAKIDAIRGQQKSAERRRGLMIVGVCVVVALLIIGAAAYQPIKDWWDKRELDELALGNIGGPASVCGEVETESAEGNSDHVPYPEEVAYDQAPPAFGPHWLEPGIAPAAFEKKFYAAGDRPELESLVHNLEHGYTILWYDESIAEDDEALLEVEALADKFTGTDDFSATFIAAPWTEEDGEASPPVSSSL